MINYIIIWARIHEFTASARLQLMPWPEAREAAKYQTYFFRKETLKSWWLKSSFFSVLLGWDDTLIFCLLILVIVLFSGSDPMVYKSPLTSPPPSPTHIHQDEWIAPWQAPPAIYDGFCQSQVVKLPSSDPSRINKKYSLCDMVLGSRLPTFSIYCKGWSWTNAIVDIPISLRILICKVGHILGSLDIPTFTIKKITYKCRQIYTIPMDSYWEMPRWHLHRL